MLNQARLAKSPCFQALGLAKLTFYADSSIFIQYLLIGHESRIDRLIYCNSQQENKKSQNVKLFL